MTVVRGCLRLVLALILVLGMGRMGYAQDSSAVRSTELKSDLGGTVFDQSDRSTVAPMFRTLSLDLQGESLGAVLSTIESEAGLELQYSNRIVPVDRRVDVRGEGLTVREALAQALAGTGIVPRVTDSGRVLLVREVIKEAGEQKGTIRGSVVDATTGEPVANAHVEVKGTRFFAMSDRDGNFVIEALPAGRYVVEVATIGYSPMRIEDVVVGSGEVTLTFELQTSIIQLQQLIVTGVVDPIAAEKIPFSVGKVTSENLPVPSGDATTLVTAKVPGVYVMNAGTPGGEQHIQLRTPTTITKEGAPMYVVDGVILADDSRPIDIDALDVESVEIIKGAAAASLYGSRAAAGVIAITTRRGTDLEEGATQITVRSEYGVNAIGRKIDLNDSHWFETNADGDFIDANGNVVRAANRRVVAADRISDKAYKGRLYDNFSEFFHPGHFTMHSASVAQRGRSTNFLASYSNHSQEGVLRGHGGYDRNTFRLNVDHYLNDDLDLSLSASHIRAVREEVIGSPFSDLLAFPPDIDLGARDESGEYIPYPDSTINTSNPIWRQGSAQQHTNRIQTLARGEIRYRPTHWFRLESQLGYNRADSDAFTYIPRGTPSGLTGESTGSVRRDVSFSDALNASVSASAFHNFFDRLNARVTLRGMLERQESVSFHATGRDLYVRGIPRLELGQQRPIVGSSQMEIRSSAYFVQAGMDYEGKYIGDFLIRRDGSSLFGPDTRWNTYYRAALAYRLTEEEWWPFGVFDEFKLRSSIGTAGGRPGFNDQYETYLVSYLSATRSTLGNRRLRPSHTREVELGADIVAFGRFGLELTYARQISTDQIIQVPQPAATGFKNRWENAGTIEGYTYEATLRADLYRGRDLSWSMQLVADRSRNEITKWDQPCFIAGLTRHCEGVQRGDIYGYRYVRDAAQLPELHANSADHFQVNDDGFLVPVGAGNSWRDGIDSDLWGTKVEIDGVEYDWGLPITMKNQALDADSLVYLGSMAPKVRLGYGNTINWKGLTIYGLIDWQVGGKVHNVTKQRLYQTLRAGDVDQTGKAPETKKPIDYYTRLGSTGNTVIDHFIEPGGFIKLRELSLRYRVPDSFLQQVGFGRLGADRVNVALIGRNLFTYTKYTGFDPEVGSIFYRSDNFGYPNFRTVTANVEIVF